MISQKTINELKEIMRGLQASSNDYIDQNGNIKNVNKFKYQVLVRDIDSFRQCIWYLENMSRIKRELS